MNTRKKLHRSRLKQPPATRWELPAEWERYDQAMQKMLKGVDLDRYEDLAEGRVP